MEQFYKNGSAEIPAEWLVSLKKVLCTASVSQEEMKSCMLSTYKAHNYILEPHSAIGVVAFSKVRGTLSSPLSVVCLATATPAKFSETVEAVLQLRPPVPEPYKRLLTLRKHSSPMAKTQNWESILREEIQRITAGRTGK